MIDALRTPLVEGVNATPIVQEPPAATFAQVLVVIANSDALLLDTLLTLTDCPPTLLIVTG